MNAFEQSRAHFDASASAPTSTSATTASSESDVFGRPMTERPRPSKLHVPNLVSAADLMAQDFPEPKWAVPGLVPEGFSLLVGAPKVGKSWLALDLATAIAGGGLALGGIEVDQGDVLYLALEDTPRRLQGRLRKRLAGEIPPPDLHFAMHWRPLDQGGDEDLARWLEEHRRARLVVVDVLAKVKPRASNTGTIYESDYAAVQPLKTLADDFGVAVTALHHSRKAGADDYLDTVSGSAGLAGSSDATLILRRGRGEADAELLVTGRDVEESETAMRFDTEQCRWHLLGDASWYRMSESRRVVVELLGSMGPMPPKQVSEAIEGMTHDGAKQLLRRMAEDGVIKNSGGTYSVSPASPSSPASLLSDVSDVSDGTGKQACETDGCESVATVFPPDGSQHCRDHSPWAQEGVA